MSSNITSTASIFFFFEKIFLLQRELWKLRTRKSNASISWFDSFEIKPCLHQQRNGKGLKYFWSHFRYGVLFKSIAGESKSVTSEMTAPCTETNLPTVISRYHLKNMFNADEFRLFYQCWPNKILHLKGGKCSGGKHSKVRLIGLAADMPVEKEFKCLSLESLLNHDVLKVLKHCFADTVLNIKVGCLKNFSKILYISLIKNLRYLTER